jgi:hypothetical protein
LDVEGGHQRLSHLAGDCSSAQSSPERKLYVDDVDVAEGLLQHLPARDGEGEAHLPHEAPEPRDVEAAKDHPARHRGPAGNQDDLVALCQCGHEPAGRPHAAVANVVEEVGDESYAEALAGSYWWAREPRLCQHGPSEVWGGGRLDRVRVQCLLVPACTGRCSHHHTGGQSRTDRMPDAAAAFISSIMLFTGIPSI